ncbi:MAG: hypothetical protein NUW21_04465 [Elusimicrobia bacterium]|nr:hypothetical protein [Elusimicrobiota bacterium]
MVWVEVGPGRTRLVRKDRLDAGYKETAGVFYFRGDDLSKDDAKSLSIQVGKRVTTWSEAREAMAAKGLRFVEPGERNAKVRRELREWAAASPETRGPMPETVKQRRQVPQLDMKKLFREARERREGR